MLKTLVVDDNDDFRRSLVELLCRSMPEMEVAEAVCGREARQKVKSLTPNLLFMDIRLPDENGFEISKQLKNRYPGMDIVLMSSFDMPEYRNAAEKLGAKYFLAKGMLTENIRLLLDTLQDSH